MSVTLDRSSDAAAAADAGRDSAPHQIMTRELMGHGPTVVLTQAPADTPASALGDLVTRDLRVVAMTPTPGRLGKHGIALDVLRALGKSHTVTGKPRHSSKTRDLVPLWLNAHRTRTLIATACQHTDPKQLLDLVDMCQATSAQVVLAVDHGYLDDIAAALTPCAPTILPWPSRPTPPTPRDSGRGGTPDDDRSNDAATGKTWHPDAEEVLPNVEYWTFYATARRQLPPERFAAVHDLYVDTMTRTTDWLTQHKATDTPIEVKAAHHALTTLLREQPTFDAVTVVVRATQAAFHNAGWHLDVDERELRNGLVRFQPTQTLPELFLRLRAYQEPARAATVALYLADATPTDIRTTTVDDLAQWRADPTLKVANVTVPGAAAPYLRAALLARANDGANVSDQAFPGDKRRVLLDIRQAAKDLDLNIGDANLNETHTLQSRRVPHRIVTLRALT